MKTTILKTLFSAALIAGIFSSCVKDDDYEAPQLTTPCELTTLVKNREVYEISANAIVAQHVRINPTTADIIEAYVTSSDIAGNFFKSISFETLDKTKAFSIPVDATSTFIDFPIGTKVLINLDGLYTDVKDGGMRIGGLYNNSSGGAEVGRLPEAQFRAAVQATCTVVNEDLLVKKVTIAEAKSDDNLNKLIEIDNVQFEPNAKTSTYYNENNDIGGSTNWNLQDFEGQSVIFRTSSFSNFAGKPVATGNGTVRGVMTKYGSDYQFIARTVKDVELTGGEAFTPLISEGFDGGLGLWNAVSVTGTEVWTYSSSFGNPGSMAKMSGYNGGNRANEDWLISQSMDMSGFTNALFAFDNAYKFTGNPIVALISNNYTSGNPNAATWTVLPCVLSTGNYIYANSGPLNIAAFTGAGNQNVHIAIKYTSTTNDASTWEVDNIIVNAK